MHYQLVLATQSLLALWPYCVVLATAGVVLYADWVDENYYIETTLGFSQDTLELALRRARSLGLEVMPESECPAEVRPDGTVRIYLAQIRSSITTTT